MLLTRLVRAARERDEGAALATVLGLMLVGVLLTTLISGAIVSAYGFSSSTRAGVASRSSAEAGVAAAHASLVAGTCDSGFDTTHPSAGVYQSAVGATPEYEAAVFPMVGGTWATTPACPSSATAPVRIISTGAAQATGAAGQSAGDETTLEAVFSAPAVPTEIMANGPAVYAYSSGGFGGGGTLLSIDGATPDIMVRTGDVYCDGGAGATANLVVNGNMTIAAGCGISGTAWASGTVTLSGGAMVGNIRAQNVVLKNGTVLGDVHSLGDMTVPSGSPTVHGRITAKNLYINTSAEFTGKVWVYGQSTINHGDYSTSQWVTKTYTKPNNVYVPNLTATSPAVPSTSPWQLPPPPTIPVWIDFGYDAAYWPGFTEVVLGTNCSYSNVQAQIDALDGVPVLLDARGCTSFEIASGDHLEVSNDLAIIANKFRLVNNSSITSTGGHRIWLINPDNAADGTPTALADCANAMYVGSGFEFLGNPTTTPPNVMMYSPCRVTLGTNVAFHGQVFAAETAIESGAEITYTAVGLPGFDLSTGLSTVALLTEEDRRLESIRNLSDAG
jgi:cytoskeletal protein CcmA (bactofilin family)